MPVEESSKANDRVEWITHRARYYQQRTGQYLFNELPHEIAELVRSTRFDPFYKNLSDFEIAQWFDDHIIFADDGEEIIVLFNGNEILWEKE